MIRLQDATLKFKNSSKAIFSRLNVTIYEGDRIALVGSNGCGKSTLLKVLLNEIKLTSGAIKFERTEHTIAYIPQDFRNAWLPWLSVRKNILLSLDIYGKDANICAKYMNQLLDLLNECDLTINLDTYPYQLSGGQQHIVLLFVALLRPTQVVMADEPFAAIDFRRREIVEQIFMRSLTVANRTVVMVTHDISQAVFFSSRLLLMDQDQSSNLIEIKVPAPFPRSVVFKVSAQAQEIEKQAKQVFSSKNA